MPWRWYGTVESNSQEELTAVAVGPNGEVVVGGLLLGGTTTVIAHSSDGGSGASTDRRGSPDGILVKYSRLGVAQWARTLGGSGNDSHVSAVTVDHVGNIYATGFISAGGQFDSVGNPPITFASATNYLAKYSATGSIQWAVRLGNFRYDHVGSAGLGVDPVGNVYVVGAHAGGLFSSNGPTTVLPPIVNGSAAAFLAKYDSGGMYQWHVSIDGNSDTGMSADLVDVARDVAVDCSGNAWVVGHIVGTVTLDNIGGTPLTINNAAGLRRMFIARYSPTGGLGPSAAFNTLDTSTSAGIALAPNGGVYVAGSFATTLTLGNGYTPQRQSAFVARFDSSAVAMWMRVGEGANNAYQANRVRADTAGNAMAVLSGQGDVVWATGFNLMGTNGPKGVWVRIEPAGTTLNVSQSGGNATAFHSLAVDPFDARSHVVGGFSGSATLIGPSGADFTMASSGSSDGFLAPISCTP